LPCFLQPDPATESLSATALMDGLTLTGHFVSHRVFSLVHKELPVARLRLAHLVSKRYNIT
ncbi:MAG: DNA repair protein RecO, partial [Candidatus Puniceispirillaceae bacterium]